MTEPVTDAEFAALMARLGPFWPVPSVAVAVSGGADSLALVHLVQRWAMARSGAALALTVDHRLRPESSAEAAQVAEWMAACGVAHATLTWAAPPAGATQAQARAARHHLLESACRDRGIGDLLLGHTMDDQAETVLLRLAKGSGIDGLAGMAPLRWRPGLRLLRPLLTVPKARLHATCAAFGQPWIEDPSNLNPRYARARLRRTALTALGAEGLTAERLAETARRAGLARAALDQMAIARLDTAAMVFPTGHVVAERRALLAGPIELALRALVRCLNAVGGTVYPPRRARLDRLHAELAAGSKDARTLGGCLIRPLGRSGDRLLICREPSAAAESLSAPPGATLWWDGRFRVTVPRELGAEIAASAEIRCLGPAGRRALPGAREPAAVLATLPGLWSGDRLLAAPALAGRSAQVTAAALPLMFVEFAPRRPIADPEFAVV